MKNVALHEYLDYILSINIAVYCVVNHIISGTNSIKTARSMNEAIDYTVTASR